MISGMRIIMNFRSAHMIIRCGSTVRPVRSSGDQGKRRFRFVVSGGKLDEME